MYCRRSHVCVVGVMCVLWEESCVCCRRTHVVCVCIVGVVCVYIYCRRSRVCIVGGVMCVL